MSRGGAARVGGDFLFMIIDWSYIYYFWKYRNIQTRFSEYIKFKKLEISDTEHIILKKLKKLKILKLEYNDCYCDYSRLTALTITKIPLYTATKIPLYTAYQRRFTFKAYDKTAAAYNKKCYIKQQQHIIKNAIKCKSNRLCGSALLSGVTRYTRSILHPQSLLSIQINGCFLSLLYKGIYISVLGREFIFICCF